MTKRCLILLLILILPLSCAAEGLLSPETEPEELGEFDLAPSEPDDTTAPEGMADPTPLPTLEPGSLNYPEDKITFEDEIWTVLTRQWGLSDFQAAGLMSSLYLESAFSPYNAQSVVGLDDRGRYKFKARDGVGFGLCQWTTSARKSALQRYAVEHGDTNLVWDFDIQMGFMRQDINLAALAATKTLYDATEWAVMHFERPNQAYENSWPGSRYAIALQIFETHANRPYDEPAPAFSILNAEGDDLSNGFILDTFAELSVSSNYYWRLDAPDWLSVECRDYYAPDAWEERACGYSGETTLRLRRSRLPLLREGELRFEIYTGDRAVRTVPLAYTGATLPEALFGLVGFALKLAQPL